MDTNTTALSSITKTLASLNETYRDPFDDVAVAIAAGLLIPMALFGIFANVLTIVVIYKAPKLQSIFNYYIMSLCFSDLLSAVISPLAVYRRLWGFDYWAISDVLCKFYWGGDMATSISTSYHIVAFSALRLISVAFPHIFNKITLQHAKISIICIWLCSVGSGFIPFALFFGATKIERNSHNMNKAWPCCSLLLPWVAQYSPYSKYGYIFMFYIPLGLVFVQSFATSVLFFYRRSSRLEGHKNRPVDLNRDRIEAKRQKKENHAILQLALIVGSFAMGYLPNTIYLATLLKPVTPYERTMFWWFGTIVYICLRCSECLNPIFYNLASSKLRKETMRLLRKCTHKKNNLPSIRKSTSAQTAT